MDRRERHIDRRRRLMDRLHGDLDRPWMKFESDLWLFTRNFLTNLGISSGGSVPFDPTRLIRGRDVNGWMWVAYPRDQLNIGEREILYYYQAKPADTQHHRFRFRPIAGFKELGGRVVMSNDLKGLEGYLEACYRTIVRRDGKAPRTKPANTNMIEYMGHA